MKASQLINDLKYLIEKHGDLPVTLAIVTREYSISSVGHADEGPLQNLMGIQQQNPPDRFVLEGKDDLD